MRWYHSSISTVTITPSSVCVGITCQFYNFNGHNNAKQCVCWYHSSILIIGYCRFNLFTRMCSIHQRNMIQLDFHPGKHLIWGCRATNLFSGLVGASRVVSRSGTTLPHFLGPGGTPRGTEYRFAAIRPELFTCLVAALTLLVSPLRFS